MSETVLLMRGLGGEVDLSLPDLWLADYDPEGNDGYGYIVWTEDRSKAIVFKDFHDAFEALRSVPECRPVRDDGHPNRPLTAFSVEFAKA